MDVEISAFDPFVTSPRGPWSWCNVRTRYVRHGPHDRPPPPAVVAAATVTAAPDPAAWSTPRSHRCGTACFAAAVDIAGLTAGVAVHADIEEPSRPAVDRCYLSAPLAPRRTLPRPRSLFDICEGDPSPDQKPRRFTFAPPRPPDKPGRSTTYAFSASPAAPRRPKRARPAADVDGPHTASLSSKKRRLRLELVTSPLSQPFSVPATHILNREVVAAGDRRFLRMAAHVEMVRRGWDLGGGHHAAISSLRRFALLNRTRATLGDCSWTELGRYLSGHRPPAAGRQRSRSTSPRPAAGRGAGTLQPQLQVQAPKAAAVAKPPIIPPPSKVQSPPTPPSCHPASPSPPPPGRPAETGERDVVRRSIHDDEDYCEAFPDTRYDSSDDSEDVYSDFSAIFGSEASRPADDAHLFEDYLDELDGISWAVR